MLMDQRTDAKVSFIWREKATKQKMRRKNELHKGVVGWLCWLAGLPLEDLGEQLFWLEFD